GGRWRAEGVRDIAILQREIPVAVAQIDIAVGAADQCIVALPVTVEITCDHGPTVGRRIAERVGDCAKLQRESAVSVAEISISVHTADHRIIGLAVTIESPLMIDQLAVGGEPKVLPKSLYCSVKFPSPLLR